MRLIDADALINLIKNSCSMGGYMGKVVEAIYEYFIKVVESMPTAVDLPELKEAYQDGYKDGQNDRPQGEWIQEDDTDEMLNIWECSLCKMEFCSESGGKPHDWLYNFCPNCGADMREGGVE